MLLFTRHQTLKYAVKKNNVVRRIGFRCQGKASTLAAARAALGANSGRLAAFNGVPPGELNRHYAAA